MIVLFLFCLWLLWSLTGWVGIGILAAAVVIYPLWVNIWYTYIMKDKEKKN